MLIFTLLWGLYCVRFAKSVTVYGQAPLAATQTQSGGTFTTNAAYDQTVLDPPPIPNPPSATAFPVVLQPTNTSVVGISIPQIGAFFGFSIEMSVLNQVLGKNSSFLQVPFLNLMGNIQQRAGSVHVRCGGNTQDYAVFVDSLANGSVIGKQSANTLNPTETPAVLYTEDLFYMLNNISSLVNVRWYLGIPFNDTSNFRLQIAEYGEGILGDNLIGLQVGNEPDLYVAHGHRNASYGPFDYYGEFGTLVQALAADSNVPVRNNLIAPSISGTWTPEMVWNTGFITEYTASLGALAVEHYPDDNCFALYGVGSPVNIQDEFAAYLNHSMGQNTVAPYLNSTSIAQAAGKPFLMFETNSASCGGFPGISDSFGAGLWALDYGLQMAYSNFSGAMLHVGGQNVYYNPFTPPPTNESEFHEWTIGAVFYSALIVAEAFGPTNTSQVVDLEQNSANPLTPQYAIYENGAVARVALFNYVTDPSGASDYVASISIGGGNTGAAVTTPAQVQVKYFLSPSVSTKDNITWAGQTFGTEFEVDGRLNGDLNVTTITCDQATNSCPIPVPAPGFALVFLSQTFLSESNPSTEITFSTTAYTKTQNTAAIAPSVLATSNGFSGKDRVKLGSTSKGSANDATPLRSSASGIVATLVLVTGITVMMKSLISR